MNSIEFVDVAILGYVVVSIYFEILTLRGLASEKPLQEVSDSLSKSFASPIYVFGTICLLFVPGLPRLIAVILLVLAVLTTLKYGLRKGEPISGSRTFWVFDCAASTALLATLGIYILRGLF